MSSTNQTQTPSTEISEPSLSLKICHIYLYLFLPVVHGHKIKIKTNIMQIIEMSSK